MDIASIIDRTEKDIVELGRQSTEAISKGYEKTVDEVSRTANNFINTSAIAGTNITGDLMHSGRFVAKNTIGALDNTQDNLFQFLTDIRVDIANTLQLTGIAIGVGFGIFVILYGERVFKNGISLGNVSFL